MSAPTHTGHTHLVHTPHLTPKSRSLCRSRCAARLCAQRVLLVYLVARSSLVDLHGCTPTEAHSNLGVLAYSQGQYEAASRSFEAAIALAPAFADAYQHLGAARKALGDAEGALAAYGTASRMDPAVRPTAH